MELDNRNIAQFGLEHLAGGQGVAGSNPVVPTTLRSDFMENFLKFIYMKWTFEEEVKDNDFFFKLFRIWMFILFFKASFVGLAWLWILTM